VTTANLLPSEVAAHECIEHFTLPGTDRSNPPGILTAHSVPVGRFGPRCAVSGTAAAAGITGAYVESVNDHAGGPRVARQHLSTDENRRASRHWWDIDADNYQAEHGAFLGDVDFVWCPEGLREADVQLLGPVAGARVLEVGCGAAAAARWLVTQGAEVVAVDLSAGMLRHAAAAAEISGVRPALLQCDALELPVRDASIDIAFTAFGAVPFIDDSARVMREVFRVLHPGGRWVFSATHPMRWIFLDDPGPQGLVATHSYFDRRPYVEFDPQGRAVYVEHHRTLGDRIRELVAAGFVVRDVIEPEWPEDHHELWGQWSPRRGALFPGTAIYVSLKPA
jgi:SAM-dependent methyltransferase